MKVREHNRIAWDAEAERGNQWTLPVSAEAIEAARRGQWAIVLTPITPVPRAWFGALTGSRVLCLASGGGQQGPILAAAGASVTVFDNSPRQLERDEAVARRHGLPLRTVLGDMADLGVFADGSFDLIVHPVSNCFVPDIRPVWREAFRVLRGGGALLAGFCNPVLYVFDRALAEQGTLDAQHALPYADTDALSPAAIDDRLAAGVPLEFGHTLEAQMGGQLDAGFVIVGIYEDREPPDGSHPLNPYMATFIATRSIKYEGTAP